MDQKDQLASVLASQGTQQIETNSTYAAETNGTITHLSGPLDSDHAAQEWHRELGNPGTLVVLDLAEGETPSVGDSIDIDSDGVATLCVAGVEA